MKGTAILFQEDRKVTIIEDIDHKIYEEIKDQIGCEECSCKLNDKVIHLGPVHPALWHDEEIDWDYGY
jgi:hypothetical protein